MTKKTESVLRQIRRFQKSTNLLILKISFDRVIKEIFQKMRKSFRIQSIALLILQEATKTMIVKEFEDNICQYYFKTFLTISINSDKLVCDTLQKNYVDSEEHEFIQEVEKSARTLNRHCSIDLFTSK